MGFFDKLLGRRTSPSPSTQAGEEQVVRDLYALAKTAYSDSKTAESDADKHEKILDAVRLLDQACRVTTDDDQRTQYVERWKKLVKALPPQMQTQAIQHALNTCRVMTQSVEAHPLLVQAAKRLQNRATPTNIQPAQIANVSSWDSVPSTTTTAIPLTQVDQAFERLCEAYALRTNTVRLTAFLHAIEYNPGMAREAVHKALSQLNPSIDKLTLIPAEIYEADHDAAQNLTTALLRVASDLAKVDPDSGRFLPLTCDLVVACVRLAPSPNLEVFSNLCVETIQRVLDKSEHHADQEIREATKGFYQNIAKAIDLKEGRLRTEFLQTIANHHVTELDYTLVANLFDTAPEPIETRPRPTVPTVFSTPAAA